jgi:hypothetical protein
MRISFDRVTVLLNVAALGAACIVAAQTVYIVGSILGTKVPIVGASWYVFVPPLIMFIINNRRFSYFFLFVHIALIINLSFESWRVYVGTPIHYLKGLTNSQELVFILSLMCFAAYLIAGSVQFVLRVLDARRGN